MAALIWSHFKFLFNNWFIQQLFYSTAYSLDESLIPTGFIQLFIPMAALIWSHFLFNNWFYSTTVLFNCLIQLFIPGGRPYLVALFIQLFILFNLNGRPYLVTLILFPALLQLIYFFFFFFFFFFFGKKGALPGIRTRDLLISSLDT